MAEIAFSENGKYFSAISQDGRLRIWDTETNVLKQEYTPDLHLSAPPSCLQWISARNTETPQKGRRSASFSENESQYIALGTRNGKILVYSVSQAKVETVLEDSNINEIQNNSITALDWHKKYGLLSCNKDGYIHEWDIRSGQIRNKYNVIVDSKNKQTSYVNAIKIVPHNQKGPYKFVVTASWQLRVWRLHMGIATPLMTLGHSGSQKAILNIADVNHKTWLIVGSQNERLLSFWDVTIASNHIPQVDGEDVSPTKKQRKKSITADTVTVPSPTYNFVLEDAPRIVDVDLRTLNGSVKVGLSAATRSGVVHYYSQILNGASAKPVKPSVTVQISTEDAVPMQLQCCKFTADGERLVLGYESGPGRITFERLVPETKSKTQVVIRGEAKSAKQQKSGDNRRTENDDKVTYVEPLGGVVRKRGAPGGKVEVPMESRLENLTLDTTSRSKSAVSQNLTKLLVQGLHSKDKDLILTVIQQNDPAVAQRTVQGLPADYVPLLLEQLTVMAHNKTSQCASVCTWLGALVRCHSALLLATVSSQSTGDKLSQLLAAFTQRRSHLCQLLNLRGRLQLVTAQRQHRDIEDDTAAVLEYNDTSSSEDEVELRQSDNESWDALDSEQNDMDED